MRRFGRIIVVTRMTQLQELLERYVTKAQAQFYIEHMGLSFSDYEKAHNAYETALEALRRALPSSPRYQFIDRSFLPTFSFFRQDLVLAIGNNGLVVNTAKYLNGQLILGVNADPEREEGILTPFEISDISNTIERVLEGKFETKRITMAKAVLNDGQELLGFNDLFIGHRSHVSARYRIVYDGVEENHLSSGIIVSTGAGATGWMKSVLTGAYGILGRTDDLDLGPYHLDLGKDWSADKLLFAVREPWPSKRTQTGVVFGSIDRKCPLRIVSRMPEGGVIFSDGVERDALSFNSGAIATIGIAEQKANLITSV
jgi:NAD kinase